MDEEKLLRVRRALSTNRHQRGPNAVRWPFLTGIANLNKRAANKFLLGAIVDYQVPWEQAWEGAQRFAEETLKDPPDLWREIVEGWTEAEWNSRSTWKKYGLHRRFPAGHNRVRAIGLDILRQYNGDAREIWRGQSPHEVMCRLEELGNNGVGAQLSRMIVGALIDTDQIRGSGQFKADTHVRRVLGRVFDAKKASESRTFELGEELSPGNSWEFDGVLFLHGMETCTQATPTCDGCFLAPDCAYRSDPTH